MGEMKIGKAIGSIAGVFLLVYGTALLYRLLFGGYMLKGGLANLNYGALAMLCAVPFVWLSLIGTGKGSRANAGVMGAALFSVLFALVHLVVVLSSGTIADDAVVRTLIVFPVTALLLAAVLHITEKNGKIA